MRGEGVGTLRAASEEYTRVIISRESRESHESHESHEILLYVFGAICVSKKPRTLHADVPTFLIAHRSSLTAHLLFVKKHEKGFLG